jgi:hypothetical protein
MSHDPKRHAADILANARALGLPGYAANTAEGHRSTVAAAEAPPVPDAVVQAARQKERQRIAAIVNSTEAKGRQKFALHLAMHSEMPLETAKALLAAAAIEVDDGGTQQH